MPVRIPLVVALAVCAACDSKEQAPAQYDVRAEVTELSGEGDDARVSLRHEAIPSFKNRDGKVVGMDAMTMAFGVASGVDRSALEKGAKLRVRFEVDWGREPALMVTSIEPLPGDTALELD